MKEIEESAEPAVEDMEEIKEFAESAVAVLETREMEIAATDDAIDLTVRAEECAVEGRDVIVDEQNELAQQRRWRADSNGEETWRRRLALENN
jgi:hypothetical protein